METVVCRKCQSTEIEIFSPTPAQQQQGYIKTGNCENAECGHIFEIHNMGKPKVEFSRFGPFATTADVKTSVAKVLRVNKQYQKSQNIIDKYDSGDFNSFDEFVEFCKEYVELVEV